MDEACSRALDGFRSHFGGEPTFVVRAPGRANMLGAHVDYSEGWVLPGALDRSVWLAFRPLAGGRGTASVIRALDVTGDGEASAKVVLDAERLPPPVPEREIDRHGGRASWLDLPRGVAWVLARSGHRVPPIEAAFASDLPIGAGVSSSAAIEVAFLMAWETAAGIALDGVERARLGRRVENDYLGVGSGIMDQFASIHGKNNHLILLDCRDSSFEQVALPGDVAVVIADSGVRRSLVDSGYNSRPEECRQAVAALRAFLPEIRTLRDVSEDDLERHATALPPTLRKRARHAVQECRRVLDGAAALRNGNLLRFGELMCESHASSRDLYEVSIPELDLLASAARSSPGCYGARLSGAGFGGCVIALVETGAAGEVEHRLRHDFELAFGRPCETFVSGFGDGANLEPMSRTTSRL